MSGETRTARELAHVLSRLTIGEDCGRFGDTCDEDCDEVTAFIQGGLTAARNAALEEAARRCDAVRAAGGDAWHCAVEIRALKEKPPA